MNTTYTHITLWDVCEEVAREEFTALNTDIIFQHAENL